MKTFRVDDMTCGHCARTITQAVHAVDAGARVEVDLARHLVVVDAVLADASAIGNAIAAAGYSAVPVAADRPARMSGSGGCCGGGARATATAACASRQ